MLVQLRRFGYNKTSDWQGRRRSYACVRGIAVGYHVQTCLLQSLHDCYWDCVVDRYNEYSTVDKTSRAERFSPFVALQCGWCCLTRSPIPRTCPLWACFKSGGPARCFLSLLYSFFFSPKPSDILAEEVIRMHRSDQSQFLTHRVLCTFQAFTAEVTRSVSRHDNLSCA